MIFLRWLTLARSHPWQGPVLFARGAPGFAAARNIVAKQLFELMSVGEQIDALLFWDADQLPPHWFPWPSKGWDRMLPGWSTKAPSGTEHFLAYLERLLIENPEKEVFAGIYFDRNPVPAEELPYEPVAYQSAPPEEGDPPDFQRFSRLPVERLRGYLAKRGLYKVDGAGTGAMLIRTDVLIRLANAKGVLDDMLDHKKRPARLFEQPQLPKASNQAGLQWTEDLLFCHEIGKLDPPVDIWLDTVMESGHASEEWISHQHWAAVRGLARFDQATARRQKELVEQGRRETTKGRIWTPG